MVPLWVSFLISLLCVCDKILCCVRLLLLDGRADYLAWLDVVRLLEYERRDGVTI
jgi:hypothetical protein